MTPARILTTAQRYTVVVLAILILAGCSRAKVRPDDAALQALVKAQQALHDAPTCRATVMRTYMAHGRHNGTVVERIGDSLFREKTTANGVQDMDLITDGRDEYLDEGGRFVEEHGDAAATLRSCLRECSLDDLVKDGESGKLISVGREVLEGQPASIYLVETHEPDMTVTTKIWIRDADSRPLKTEGELRHFHPGNGQTSGDPDQKISIAYAYDPSIRITFQGQ